MNSNSYSYGGFTLPEPNEKVLHQLESIGFVSVGDNDFIHPDLPGHKIDVSHTEESGLASLLYETFFLAGYKQKEDQIKQALGIS